MKTKTERPRACAAVLRKQNTEILMVKHSWPDGSENWILPGGGLLPNESFAEAAIRELKEETGIDGIVIRELFTRPYELGVSKAFLIDAQNSTSASLGIDPEDSGHTHKKLTDLKWMKIQENIDNPEIKELVFIL